jgi:hypothetical protein
LTVETGGGGAMRIMYIIAMMLVPLVYGRAADPETTGCIGGTLFYDASGLWPYAERCITVIDSARSDTITTRTDQRGAYTMCGLLPGTYRLWAVDSSALSPRLVMDSTGRYDTTMGGYTIPGYIRKMVRTVHVPAAGTLRVGSMGLFLPENMTSP